MGFESTSKCICGHKYINRFDRFDTEYIIMMMFNVIMITVLKKVQ